MRCGWGLYPREQCDSRRYPHPARPAQAGEGAQRFRGRSSLTSALTLERLLQETRGGERLGVVAVIRDHLHADGQIALGDKGRDVDARRTHQGPQTVETGI